MTDKTHNVTCIAEGCDNPTIGRNKTCSIHHENYVDKNDRIAQLETQLAEVIGCYDEFQAMPCASLEERLATAIKRARIVKDRNTSFQE